MIFTLLASLLGTTLMASSLTKNDLSDVNGNWHLRVLDGHNVKKARAIVDFHAEQMIIEGFDGCNRISGYLKAQGQSTFYSKLRSSRMACRQNIHRYTSQRVKAAIKEGFTITKGTRFGIEGITLKSKHHDLFFKKMGGTGSIMDMIK
jgi:heat shock protein HslJ